MGSEMCIRDRLSPTLRSNGRLRRRRRHQGDAPSTPTRLLPPLIPNILPPPPPTSEVSTMTEQTSRTVIPPDTGVEVPLETPQASRSRLRRRNTRFINPTAAETFPTMEEFNSPVRIRPSRHQISEATELMPKDSEGIIGPLSVDFTVYVMPGCRLIFINTVRSPNFLYPD